MRRTIRPRLKRHINVDRAPPDGTAVGGRLRFALDSDSVHCDRPRHCAHKLMRVHMSVVAVDTNARAGRLTQDGRVVHILALNEQGRVSGVT